MYSYVSDCVTVGNKSLADGDRWNVWVTTGYKDSDDTIW